MKKIKIIALFAALIAGLAIYQFLKEISKPQEIPRTAVVVAAADIPMNTQITESMVVLQPIATESLLPGYMTDLDSVIGMVLSGDVFTGEQITGSRLVRMGEADSASNTLAYVVRPGMRAVTVSVNPVTGMANLLKPGNRVDLVVNYSYEEITKLEDGSEESETIYASRLLVQNAEVLAVGSALAKEGAEEYATVTLQVTPEEAVNISFSEFVGNLRLILRSSLDGDQVDNREVTLDVISGK